jgi:DNA-binding transcriptional LysR family regulator
MLKRFKEHVGVPIFETARKSRLTLLGRQVLDEARREIEHFDRTVAAIDGLSNAELCQVSLTVTLSIPQSIMPPILRDFVQAHRMCGSTSAAWITRRSSGTSAREFLTLA